MLMVVKLNSPYDRGIEKSIILKYFFVPMLFLIGFILVIAGMIMYYRYSMSLDSIFCIDVIAGILLVTFAYYPVWKIGHTGRL